MIAIHTKYLNPTNSRGARIKAYTAGWGDRKGFEAIISYPHEESGHMRHFRAVQELVRKNGLDWDLSNMRWGDSADGRGYSFCFNCSKVEDKLAKVKPPVHSIPKPSAQDRARVFPVYKPGMSTADYVRLFEERNVQLTSVYSVAGSHPLNCQPAAQYDPSVPLCVEDANPDYIPGVDDAPVKPKARSARRDPKAERIAALEDALQWVTACLLNPNGVMDQLAAIEKAQSLLGGEK